MRRNKFYFVLAALFGAALACNAPGAAPTADLAGIVAATQTAIAVSYAVATPSPTADTLAPGPTTPIVVATPITPGATLPVGTSPSCVQKAAFVSETIPDNTQFLPGQPFVKTWTLQNSGTCTWTPEYALVFLRGEQMSGTSPSPIGQTVPPGGTIQVFLPQTAPNNPGEYQGFWMLQDLNGNQFALGEDAKTPVWIKINVTGSAPTPTGGVPASLPNLGPPTTTFNFAGGNAPFYLGTGDQIDFSVIENSLRLTAIEPVGDLWRVAERSGVANFMVEARYRTGPACSGRDGYGLLLRAPNQADNIIDSGYVFGFNCDGQYRVYRMDNGAYSGIQNWSTHPSLRPGPNQENIMMVGAEGDRFRFYGNGTLLFEFYDQTYASGLWGMMIGSAGTRNFQTTVSQIAFWILP